MIGNGITNNRQMLSVHLSHTAPSLTFGIERCEHALRLSAHCVHWERNSPAKFNINCLNSCCCCCCLFVFLKEKAYFPVFVLVSSPLSVLRTQKWKTHLLRTHSSKVLAWQPGVGQNRAMHASSTARDFFLELISNPPGHSSALFPKQFPSSSCVSCGYYRFLCGPAE